MAAGLAAGPRVSILNDVVLNQVLVRVSVSGWETTEADADRSVAAILACLAAADAGAAQAEGPTVR